MAIFNGLSLKEWREVIKRANSYQTGNSLSINGMLVKRIQVSCICSDFFLSASGKHAEIGYQSVLFFRKFYARYLNVRDGCFVFAEKLRNTAIQSFCNLLQCDFLRANSSVDDAAHTGLRQISLLCKLVLTQTGLFHFFYNPFTNSHKIIPLQETLPEEKKNIY